MRIIIPDFLRDMLVQDYGEKLAAKIEKGYIEKPMTLRANTLKTSAKDVKLRLNENGFVFSHVSWCDNAFVLENTKEENIRKLSLYENGEIYLQSLSSMIPPIVLDPKKDENILDMAAAPGGKTTQMAALSNNEANITACEKNKIRYDRLKYNLEKQGARRVNAMQQDARRLDDFFSFDKILLDSPCSGSGTLSVFDKSFNKELVDRIVKVQEELLRKAIKILVLGGEIVYSTCSILKRENEEILNKFLKSGNIEIVPINKERFQDVAMLPTSIEGTMCVAPTKEYEGFFIAKIRRKI